MSTLPTRVLRRFCCGNWTRNGIFGVKHYHTSAPRYLYSADYMGIENYKRERMNIFERVGDVKDKFLARLEEYMESGAENTIFSDDLKTVIHVAENTDDVDLVGDMARRFHKESGELRFSNFVFGPPVMRMCHTLNLADKALELFKDQALSGFFDQVTSLSVLMDLLFENQRYQEVLDLLPLIHDKRPSTACVTLVMASCLKLNTDASYETMLDVVKRVKDVGKPVSNRVIVYAAMLALQRDQGGVAMEILAIRDSLMTYNKQLPRANLNVMILTFISLGKIEDAVNLLKSFLLEDQPDPQRRGNEIFQEVINQVETAVKDTNNLELNNLFDRVHSGLEQGNHITVQPFEEQLFTTIVRRSQLHDGYKKRPRSSVGEYKSDRARQTYRPSLRGSGEFIS